MTCREDVKLQDPVKDKEVLGDSAVYSVAEEQVEIFGQNVRLIDGKNRVQGRYLLYDLDDGTVKIQSRVPGAEQP